VLRSSDSFIKRYLQRVATTNSVLCVGLDPTPAHVPPDLRRVNDIEDIKRYVHEVIDIAAPLVPVIKLQFAYYAALGPDGNEMLRLLVKYAQTLGLLVILDAKRSDIGQTMEQYGNEVFGRYNADACTFVPYFGDTFNPSWIKWLKQGRMVISMIRTSNDEAAMIQDLELKESDLKIYEHLAQLVAAWDVKVAEVTDGAGSVGGVVGATWPEQASRCRQLAGDDVFFLIPGYGAQGGGADGAVAGLPNSRGEPMGAANSSRAVTLTSWWDKDKKQPREGKALKLVKVAIEAANTDLNAALERKLGIPMTEIVSFQ
jgi:orotidine-5'-phosphate decarboxylase